MILDSSLPGGKAQDHQGEGRGRRLLSAPHCADREEFLQQGEPRVLRLMRQ